MLGQCILFHSLCSQGGRPARCFNVSSAHFPSDPSVLHLGMCLLEEASCCVLFGITRGYEFYGNPTGVERKALHHPSPAASSTTAVASSEEEGLHARPLPHISGGYICDVAVNFGGGRIGTFSLPPHIVEEFSWRGGAGPPPHNAGEYFGGRGTGPPPHILEDVRPFLKCHLELRPVWRAKMRIRRQDTSHTDSTETASQSAEFCPFGSSLPGGFLKF